MNRIGAIRYCRLNLLKKSLCSYRFLSVKPTKGNTNNYERKTPLEHVLLRPGMYIGQMEISKSETWLFDQASGRMVKSHIKYSPGLLKIFDEILVNAADNRQRDKSMNNIDVTIVKNNNRTITISVKNDGKGIPIEMHESEKIMIPELIFGHLLTGSNFDDKQNLMTGGRHGYGAKLTNIFSKSFEVETYSHKTSQVYTQTWKNNMSDASVPEIKPAKKLKSDYTKITFTPDLSKFGYNNTSSEDGDDIIDSFIKIASRRVYDIAATVAPINVTLNGTKIEFKSFYDYVTMFSDKTDVIQDSDDASNLLSKSNSVAKIEDDDVDEDEVTQIDPIFYMNVNDRWSVAVMRSHTGEFENMSFVNSVWTPKGGTHVTYITTQIVQAFEAAIAKKKLPVVPFGNIRSRLMVFVKCDVENPTFDSQSKETLTKKITEFGSTCVLSAAFLKKVVNNSNILADLRQHLDNKSRMELERATKKTKGQFVDVPKLEDAHEAGTVNSLDCTLILTEGDSAKALAVAGIEVVGRKKYGVLPLRGKILNVRNMKISRVAKNQELIHLVKALGLSFSKDYEHGIAGQGLRYGHVMIMCDQDHDGSHIKGLIINFFHYFWPNLLKVEGFLQQFITPLVKVKLGSNLNKSSNVIKKGAQTPFDANIKSFYSLPEFEEWILKANNSTNDFTVKYYKGLGTNTSLEGQDYFKKLESHRKTFSTYRETIDNNSIDLAFNKTRAGDRRVWLNTKFNSKLYLDSKQKKISYEEFVDKELIQFSYADNYRSIPSAIDGLKPSQRKVLYACFKRKLDQEIKVVQLAGYVAEHTAYHHGETSLHATIIHMAQDYVGANNIPLLEPAGQFGTRAQGGQDFASPRYIFTRLSPLARYLFPEVDDALLDLLREDEQLVEPKYFIPIVPTLLVNGSEGIGTGWSTKVPQYDLGDVIDRISALVRRVKPSKPMVPSYRGFTGTIEASDESNTKYSCKGIAFIRPQGQIEVTELPIGISTNSYKEFLCGLSEEGVIRGIIENHTTNTVNFRFTLTPEHRTTDMAQLITKLKLENNILLSNMHAIDAKGKIKAFASPEAIISEYFPIRLEAYVRRKEALARKLKVDELTCANKARFVREILNGKLKILATNVSGARGITPLREDELIEELKAKKFVTAHELDKILNPTLSVDQILTTEKKKPYAYLMDMPIQSLTVERSEQLEKSAEIAKLNLESLMSKTSEDLWLADLEACKMKAKELGYIK